MHVYTYIILNFVLNARSFTATYYLSEPNSRGLFLLYFVSANNKPRQMTLSWLQIKESLDKRSEFVGYYRDDRIHQVIRCARFVIHRCMRTSLEQYRSIGSFAVIDTGLYEQCIHIFEGEKKHFDPRVCNLARFSITRSYTLIITQTTRSICKHNPL